MEDRKIRNECIKLLYPFNLLMDIAISEENNLIPNEDVDEAIHSTNYDTIYDDYEEHSIKSALITEIEHDIAKLQKWEQDLLFDRYKCHRTYESIKEIHNKKSREVVRNQIYRAIGKLLLPPIMTRVHYRLLSLTSKTVTKRERYRLMYDNGAMPYFCDIEEFFDNNDIKKTKREAWFNKLMLMVAKNGIANTVIMLGEENEKLKEKIRDFDDKYIDDKTENILNTHIADMGIPIRAYNALRRRGYLTCRDIVNGFRFGTISNVRGIGENSLNEIKDILTSMDINIDIKENDEK